MQYTISQMTSDDIKEVQQVAKDSWHHTYEGIIPREIQDSFLAKAYNDDMMLLRKERSNIFVAKVNNSVVGFVNFPKVSKDGKADLSAIYILPSFQGYGIGTALLKSGIASLDNLEDLFIDVEKENITGRTFYEAKGFRLVEEFKENFNGHLLLTVRMVMSV